MADYCTHAEVSAFLQSDDFDGTTTPTDTEVEAMINRSEERIDQLTDHAWITARARTVTQEQQTVVNLRNQYTGIINWRASNLNINSGIDGIITLDRRPIITLSELLISEDDLLLDWLNGTREVTEVKTVADVASSLNNKYFTINVPTGNMYVWFNVGGAGVDPAPAGKTGIEVTFIANRSAENIATDIATKLNTSLFTAEVVSTGRVMIRNDDYGSVTDSADVDSGFTVRTVVQGVDQSKVQSWMPNPTAGDFTLDTRTGIIYLADWSPEDSPVGYDALVSYTYGEASVPDDIKDACVMLTAIQLMSMQEAGEHFRLRSGMSVFAKIQSWRMDIKQILEQNNRAGRTINIGSILGG